MFEHTSGTSNATVVITDDGVVVFDFNIHNADQVLAGLRKLTDKKVRYLISSHSAGDHASGAWHFRDDAPICIATKNQVHDLQMQELAGFNERKESKDPRYAVYKGKELVKPDIGFDGHMTLYFGGLTFQIIAEGRGHSTGDLTVYIPQKRVFFMGDLLDTEIHPGQGESGDIFYSNVKGWIEILDRIMARQLPVDTYVPGHGPVHIGRGVKDLEEQKRYFVVMRDEVAKMVASRQDVWRRSKKNLKFLRSSRTISEPDTTETFHQTLLSISSWKRATNQLDRSKEKSDEIRYWSDTLQPKSSKRQLGSEQDGNRATCRVQQAGPGKNFICRRQELKAKSPGTLRSPATRTKISPPPSKPISRRQSRILSRDAPGDGREDHGRIPGQALYRRYHRNHHSSIEASERKRHARAILFSYARRNFPTTSKKKAPKV